MTVELVAGGAFVVVIGIVIRRLFDRLDNVEKRLDEAERALRLEATERSRVESILVRVCTGYEAVRKELLKIARRLRNGEELSESELAEIEATPEIKELLKNPLEVNA